MQTKHMEIKVDSNYTKMLRVVLNNTLLRAVNPISQTIKARLAEYCWSSEDEHMNDVFLWTPSHG